VRAVAPVPSFPEYTEPDVPHHPVPAAPPAPPAAPLQRLAATLRSWLGSARAQATPDGAVPRPAPTLPAPRPVRNRPTTELSLDRGLGDIKRTDPGFDPSRFTGYAGMLFRATQRAWMTRDLSPVRDQFTPELHAALQEQCERLRQARRVNRIEHVDVAATVTEAWQESGRDYVTAHIRGSAIDYTLDEGTGAIVDGSKTTARDVEEFWTFTRPAGLNFWMLSAVQTS